MQIHARSSHAQPKKTGGLQRGADTLETRRFDYDDTHNACTCLTSVNRAEESEMRDPGPQKGLSTRVRIYFLRTPC